MCDSPFERSLRVEHPGRINFALDIIFTLLGTTESIAKGANMRNFLLSHILMGDTLFERAKYSEYIYLELKVIFHDKNN